MKTSVNSERVFLLRFSLVLTAAVCLTACPLGAQPSQALARQIVQESGFQGGLSVLVGPWDADLALSLGRATCLSGQAEP